MSAFRSAVVPVAGLCTRLLPATTTVQKELLPVVDTPGDGSDVEQGRGMVEKHC